MTSELRSTGHVRVADRGRVTDRLSRFTGKIDLRAVRQLALARTPSAA